MFQYYLERWTNEVKHDSSVRILDVIVLCGDNTHYKIKSITKRVVDTGDTTGYYIEDLSENESDAVGPIKRGLKGFQQMGFKAKQPLNWNDKFKDSLVETCIRDWLDQAVPDWFVTDKPFDDSPAVYIGKIVGCIAAVLALVALLFFVGYLLIRHFGLSTGLLLIILLVIIALIFVAAYSDY